MKSSQNVRTIQYKVYHIGPRTEYEYNGKRYNSENEVLEKIKNENPSSRLTYYGPSNNIGNSVQQPTNTFSGYNKPYYGNNNGFNKPSYGSNHYGNSIQHPNSIHRPGNTIQYPNSNNKPHNPNEIPNHIGPVNPSNGYKPHNPYNPVSSNEISPWLDVKKYIDNNPFSAKIWRHVWLGCHYACFSKNNFYELKLRMLKESNQYRQHHKAAPLVENPQLSQLAQVYAEQLARLGRLVHDNDRRYGENLGFASAEVAYIIVKQWYDEVKSYNFYSKNAIPGTGHFTQLVWRGSREVGFGVATSRNGIYVVCKYNPKGNILTYYDKNVFQK